METAVVDVFYSRLIFKIFIFFLVFFFCWYQAPQIVIIGSISKNVNTSYWAENLQLSFDQINQFFLHIILVKSTIYFSIIAKNFDFPVARRLCWEIN